MVIVIITVNLSEDELLEISRGISFHLLPAQVDGEM